MLVFSTSPFYLKGAEIDTSPVSLKGELDTFHSLERIIVMGWSPLLSLRREMGMATSLFSLKNNGPGIFISPFYLKGDGDGHLFILSDGYLSILSKQ